MAHYLQAQDQTGAIHEVALPAEFELCHAKMEGTMNVKDRWMMAYRLGGVRVYIDMPPDYNPSADWKFGWYRRDEETQGA